MQIIRQTTEFHIEEKTAAAIGKFDGIHKGHEKLLEKIMMQKEKGLKTVIFTFDPLPAILFGQTQIKELTTRQEKEEIFERMGVDILIEFPLTESTASMSPENFIEEILVQKMNTAYVAAGTDLSFGYKGKGDAALLKNLSGKFNFCVEIIEKVCHNKREISSSYIREEIEKGNMENAAALIGNAYSISGIVEHGNQLGRTLSMPTVNLLPDERKLLPPYGVYFSRINMDGKFYCGVTNIGSKPTVSNENRPGVETYIFGFEEEIYDKKITVYLDHYRRPEKKFAGIEQLRAQLMEDKKAGRDYYFNK